MKIIFKKGSEGEHLAVHQLRPFKAYYLNQCLTNTM